MIVLQYDAKYREDNWRLRAVRVSAATLNIDLDHANQCYNQKSDRCRRTICLMDSNFKIFCALRMHCDVISHRSRDFCILTGIAAPFRGRLKAYYCLIGNIHRFRKNKQLLSSRCRQQPITNHLCLSSIALAVTVLRST